MGEGGEALQENLKQKWAGLCTEQDLNCAINMGPTEPHI